MKDTLRNQLEIFKKFNDKIDIKMNNSSFIEKVTLYFRVNFKGMPVGYQEFPLLHTDNFKWLYENMNELGKILDWNVTHFYYEDDHKIRVALEIPDGITITVKNGEIYFE